MQISKLSEICNITIGRTPPREEQKWFSNIEGMPWVSIRDLGRANKYLCKTNEFLTKKAISRFNIPIIKMSEAL